MQRRIGIGGITGFGANAPELMDGKETQNKGLNLLVREISKDCYNSFFKGTKLDYEYCDAGFQNGDLILGIEPTYMYDPLKIIVFCERISLCEFRTGYCFGPWGSGVRSKSKYYQDCKTNSKFKKFIDKWHPKLYAK